MFALLTGFLLGSLAEYLIHRMVGHGHAAGDSTAPMISRHSALHHRVFTERRGYAAHRTEARRAHVHLQFRVVFIILGLLITAGAMLLPLLDDINMIIMGISGAVASLLAYDILHWMHHAQLPSTITRLPGYSWLRGWHHQHHADSHSRYSVVLPIWDFVFFTHRAVSAGDELLQEEEEEESADGPTTSRTNTRRTGAKSTMVDLLEATMNEADAQASGDPAPKSRGSKGGARSRPLTRPKSRKAATSGAKTGGKGKSAQPSWMKALDRAMEDEVDISHSAVHEDDD